MGKEYSELWMEVAREFMLSGTGGARDPARRFKTDVVGQIIDELEDDNED